MTMRSDDFYGKLQDVLEEIRSHDIKLVIGDFNAQSGSQRRGVEHTIGAHGTSRAHDGNGERLISFCNTNEICVGNKKTWRSSKGRTYNEIDYICISNRWRSSLRAIIVRGGKMSDLTTTCWLAHFSLN